MKATDKVVIIPPTLYKTATMKERDEVGRKVKEVTIADFQSHLSNGRVGLIFAEGTRSRQAELLMASSGIVDHISMDSSVILPIALENTEKIIPPADERGLPIPNFRQSCTVIFGQPLLWEDVESEAKIRHQGYRVSFQQAAVDIVFEEIARAHREFGNESYTGHYRRAFWERYKKREGV
jgi:1-acyl-sn-glycerol-3-phosphate acyltransferase